MAVQKTISTTTDSITITFYNFSSQTYNRYVSYYIDGSYHGMATLASGKTSVTYSFEYLSPSTTYTISAELSGSSGSILASYGPYNITTDAEISYPTGDSGSVGTSNITSNRITVNLKSITSRNYDRTVYFDWYNTSSGSSGSPSLILGAYETSLSRDMINLTANTQYRFRIRALNPDGTTNYNSGYFYETTWADTDNATPSYTVSGNKISMSLSGITSRSYSRWARFQVGTTIKAVLLSAYATSASCDFTDLQFNTQYDIKFSIRNNDGGSQGDGGTRTFFSTASVTTENPNYTLSFAQSSTYNSISATVTLSEKQSFDVTCTVYLDDARSLDATISAGSLSRTRTWTSNIEPATIYKITLEDNIRNLSWNKRRRTKNNFSWSTDVSVGKQFNILATDWNKFTSQLSAKATDYDVTYNPATVAKGDKLTAEKYNNIAATINKIVTAEKEKKLGDCTTTVSTVKAGDRVMADSINQLASCLNE